MRPALPALAVALFAAGYLAACGSSADAEPQSPGSSETISCEDVRALREAMSRAAETAQPPTAASDPTFTILETLGSGSFTITTPDC